MPKKKLAVVEELADLRRRQNQDTAELKRTRILDAASTLFHEFGYRGTSVDAIAERLGVTKPFVYAHFKGKAEILAGVCGRTTAFAASAAEAHADQPGPVRARLAAMVWELTIRIIEGRIYLAVYFREEMHLPADAYRSLSSNRRRFDRALSRLLKQGVESGEFDIPHVSVVTQAITGMTTWLFNWYRADGPLSPEQMADEMARLVLSMVTKRPPRELASG
ncbi:TetR/AcrR family transcriptional regulator [Quisquiliibacterium transsilvanicum]|uniref:AcrR family transcriptional regulator n=1 Tax=Quisquiliibacterium transsilvanicum TaxID=1549638 RepID=A0A7W8HGW9_9BURK|nr:TetR/AcrR family transcriptional regulator [Quisquiliibacterium transsilvanicum]MBB5271698.1 AcrR family transcriptional regulator [Quisquiliibacterium transsilvanicum]